jgi:hypothetical protein
MNFPVLAQLLGESDFQALAAAYVRAHESQTFSIRYYGHELAVFLEQEPPYAQTPLLAELARWEWAMTEVFDAADAAPVGAADVSGFPPEQWALLRFGWHPSVRRLSLSWNVPQTWKAVSEQSPCPEPSLASQPGEWLLWRRDLSIYFRSLSPAEGAALGAAQEGHTFGEVCERLCTSLAEAQAPAQAAGYLREWLVSGMIVSISRG